MPPFFASVAAPALYAHHLRRLAARARGRRVEALTHEGVRFAQLLDEADHVSSLLARAVADGSYRPGITRTGRAQLGGKSRELAKVGALDLVVHGALAERLAVHLEPALSPRLYSYRAGRSSWQAIRWLAGVARDHRRAVADPRARGLYVLRADVQRYTDSIPIEDGAPLWDDLARALSPGAAHMAMLRALLRPAIEGEGPRDRGLLFGLPTTNVLGNLYLAPLDEALARLGGGYARYGDDVAFVSPSPDAAREAREGLLRVIAARGLTVHPDKLRVLYWNGAPRPSAAWPEAGPTRSVTFLGASVGFDGTIALPAAKWRALLGDLRGRVLRTARLADPGAPAERARLLAEVVTDAFDVRSELALAHAPLVADLVSDRAQLRQLDHLLALWIAEASSGRRGPRAFRVVGYRALRRDAALASRVVARNRGGRP